MHVAIERYDLRVLVQNRAASSVKIAEGGGHGRSSAARAVVAEEDAPARILRAGLGDHLLVALVVKRLRHNEKSIALVFNPVIKVVTDAEKSPHLGKRD